MPDGQTTPNLRPYYCITSLLRKTRQHAMPKTGCQRSTVRTGIA